MPCSAKVVRIDLGKLPGRAETTAGFNLLLNSSNTDNSLAGNYIQVSTIGFCNLWPSHALQKQKGKKMVFFLSPRTPAQSGSSKATHRQRSSNVAIVVERAQGCEKD